MDARQNGLAVRHVAHHQCNVFLPCTLVDEAVHLENAVLGGQAAGGNVFDG